MYTVIKRINLTLSIFLPALLICSFAYARGHQLADENWYKAQDLEKQGKYIDAANKTIYRTERSLFVILWALGLYEKRGRIIL